MPSPSAPLRVLVVDDCEDTRDSFALFLRAWGHEVRLACDGASALESFRAHHPDAVLLDIDLPGLDGWEVARRMRQQEELPPALLVAVTAHDREEDRVRSAAAGIDTHLTKPTGLGELRRLLATAKSGYSPGPVG